MAAVRINTVGGQKEIREESRPAFRTTNKSLNLDPPQLRAAGECRESLHVGIHLMCANRICSLGRAN